MILDWNTTVQLNLIARSGYTLGLIQFKVTPSKTC